MAGRSLSIREANHLSMSLIMSSFGKILLIVMVIWDYGNLNPSFLVNFFVLICNGAAISVALNLSIKRSALVLLCGLASQLSVIFIGPLSFMVL